MKYIMLIKVKMTTIVGILIFISRINTTPESLKQEISLFFRVFLADGISCSVELSMRMSYNVEASFSRIE